MLGRIREGVVDSNFEKNMVHRLKKEEEGLSSKKSIYRGIEVRTTMVAVRDRGHQVP